MKNSHKVTEPVDAEEIAEMASRGEDVSRFFTNKFRMVPSVQRVNVDFATPMLDELDTAAKELNISRQAVIKTFLRQALDQRNLAAEAGAKIRAKRGSLIDA